MLRYKKDHSVDGWPIVDTGSGEILDAADIVNKLNQYESILADSEPGSEPDEVFGKQLPATAVYVCPRCDLEFDI